MDSSNSMMEIFRENLWIPSREYFRTNRLFRRVFYFLVILIVLAKLLILASEGLSPSKEQYSKQILQRYTNEAARKIHNIHTVSGIILDSIADDDRIAFYEQFASIDAISQYLEPFSLGWDNLYNKRFITYDPNSGKNIAIGLYDNNAKLRGWLTKDISSPGLDTAFTSSSILERRSRLSEIDSTPLDLYYASARKLFSKQGTPVGYVLIKYHIAERRSPAFCWSLNSIGADSNVCSFVATPQAIAKTTLYLDSNERNIPIGFITVSAVSSAATSIGSFEHLVLTIEGLIELLLVGLLLLPLQRIYSTFNATTVKPILKTWMWMTFVILIVRLALQILGGADTFISQLGTFSPSGYHAIQFVMLDTPAALFLSSVTLLLSLFSLYRFSAFIFFPGAATHTRRYSSLALVALNILIPFVLYGIMFMASAYIPGMLRSLSSPPATKMDHIGYWIPLLISSAALFLGIFLLQKTLRRLIARTSLSEPLQKFAYILTAISQIAGVYVVGAIAGSPVIETNIIACAFVCSLWFIWHEGRGGYETLRMTFHPALVAIVFGSSLGFLLASRIVDVEHQQLPNLHRASQVALNPHSIIQQYIRETTDSTVRTMNEYNCRSYLFWKKFFISFPDISVRFIVFDAFSGRELSYIANADDNNRLLIDRQKDTTGHKVISTDTAGITILSDSIANVRMMQLSGLSKASFVCGLDIRSRSGETVLPSERIAGILWDPTLQQEPEVREEGYLHVAMTLTTLCIVLVFIAFIWSIVLRLIHAQSFRFQVTLQEKFLLVVFVAVGAAYNIVVGVSESVLLANTASAADEIFDRNVRHARTEIAASIDFDSVRTVEHHIQSAAEALNCDIALFSSGHILLASSMPECVRYGLIPISLPSTRSNIEYRNGHADDVNRTLLHSTTVKYAMQTIKPSRAGMHPVHFLVFQKEEPYWELLQRFSDNISDGLSALAFLALLLASYFSTRIVNPLIRLKRATADVAAGKLAVSLPRRRGDEIGEVIDSFNQMTTELSSSREQVAQVEREGAWKEMARQVAHEIKNPLTPIKLSIQHVQHAFEHQDTNFPNIFRRVLRTISEQIDVLTRIATEFARFGEMPRRRYSFILLKPVVESAIALFEAERSRIRFAVNVPTSLSKIYADEEEFRRTLVNLLKNAIQAISGWGIILVTAEERSGLIYIRITDSGAGMKPETVTKAFDPNFSTKTSGMGLGLAIVKKTITDMSGTIRVESEPGKGTTFFIELPARDPSSIVG